MDIVFIVLSSILCGFLISWALSLAQAVLFIEKGTGKRLKYEISLFTIMVVVFMIQSIMLYLVI